MPARTGQYVVTGIAIQHVVAESPAVGVRIAGANIVHVAEARTIAEVEVRIGQAREVIPHSASVFSSPASVTPSLSASRQIRRLFHAVSAEVILLSLLLSN